MRILDRYILKNFLVPFLYCCLGFLAIWLAFDIASNANEVKVSPAIMLHYYETQIPQYVVIILPIALLLSLLYSLGRMSRSNEIISILTAGQSIYRMMVPLIFVGVAVSALSFSMNYRLAPHADASKSTIIDSLGNGHQMHWDSLLFRNRADSRTWLLQLRTEIISPYERATHPDLNTVRAVHITQQDSEGNILRKYYAQAAVFDPVGRTWTFFKGKTVNFDIDGDMTTQEDWDTLKFTDWSETPWRIFSTNLDAGKLSLPELGDYLRLNADLPESQLAAYRTYWYHLWADSISCLVVVFIAVPLGIVYSRRGVLAGVAGAVFIFFGMMFVDRLLLALGKHGSIPPFFAAWGNDMVFGMVGLILLYLRSNNHDVFQLHPKNLLGNFKKT